MRFDFIQRTSKHASTALLLCFGIAGCGGGATSMDNTAATGESAAASTSLAAVQSANPATDTASAAPAVGVAQPVLPAPSAIADGSVVELACGRTYQGTLPLQGKSNVTVRTAGNCGNAVITPGQALGGWTRYQGNIYSAPVSFDVAQVIVSGKPVTAAHWPSREQTWSKATSSTGTTLSYPMPNGDLAGARLIFKPYEWAVEARKISSYSGNTMNLESTGDINFDGYALGGAADFYVEGKLWMLDEPDEWAFSDGRLYVWTADGASPEGRVWVSPEKDGIDARDSRNVQLQGVSIYGAANGVNAFGATGLKASKLEITNSSANGILNTGGSGLVVEDTTIRNSRHDAIAIKWGGGGERISNATIDATGTIGMPTNLHAAINLTAGSGAVVQNSSVTNSGYIGIRVFRDARVSGNRVDGACLVLSDCGGIFTSAPDKVALNTRIENNTVRNVGKNVRLAWGLYLGDFANGTTVTGNTVSESGNGMEILNGYDNVVSGNTFTQNTQAHVQIVESGSSPNVHDNAFNGNRFNSVGKQEMYRLSSDLGTGALIRFGSYAANTYVSSSSIFANFNGEALNFTQWRQRTGQDADSTFNAP